MQSNYKKRIFTWITSKILKLRKQMLSIPTQKYLGAGIIAVGILSFLFGLLFCPECFFMAAFSIPAGIGVVCTKEDLMKR